MRSKTCLKDTEALLDKVPVELGVAIVHPRVEICSRLMRSHHSVERVAPHVLRRLLAIVKRPQHSMMSPGRRLLFLLLLWARAARAQQAEPSSDSERHEPPAITPLRYTEDYSYLRDPDQRSGFWWEPFKYVPSRNGLAHLTFGVELRVRFEQYWNNNFGSGPKPDDGYLWFRTLPYFDLHAGEVFRTFAQLNVAYAAMSDLTRSPVDETGVELLQGFADLRVPLPWGDSTLTLRGGREVLAYGSERLISARYRPNVLLSFDGVLARWESGDWRADAFFVWPVENQIGSFNDWRDTSQKLGSLYSTRMLPEIGPDAGLDVYVIGFHDDDAEFNQGTGKETRFTTGVRFFGSLGDWEWNSEGFFQFGSFADADLRAWSVTSDVRYEFSNQPLEPLLGLKASIISGDENPADPSLQTFNPLFPKGKYFGEIGMIGPSNLYHVHPSVAVDLGSDLSVSSAVVFYWRESLGDGVYNLAGGLIRPSDGSRSRYIGTQAEVVVDWVANRNLSFNGSYSFFVPGAFIEDTGPAKTVQFVGAEVLFRM